MGTIPIYWGEADGLGDLLAADRNSHWARPVLERHVSLVPLDYLSAEALAHHRLLMLAQPRALSAEENVALDAWVRGGGRLLLFADPMMTGESRFNLGDRRRPQDVALLSPILDHWGLRLEFDENQPEGLRQVQQGSTPIPVNLAGQWVRDGGICETWLDRLVAACAVGRGLAVLVADAAMLDLEGPHAGSQEALEGLVQGILVNFGEIAGEEVQPGEQVTVTIRIPAPATDAAAPTSGADPP